MNNNVAYFEHPSGQLFEVMFHTNESKATMDRVHSYYEALRWSGSTIEEKKACDILLTKEYGKVTRPAGIGKIEHVKGIYNGKYSERYGK